MLRVAWQWQLIGARAKRTVSHSYVLGSIGPQLGKAFWDGRTRHLMFLLLRAAEWKRGSGHKLKNIKFHKNMRTYFSVARVTKNLHRLP